MSDSLKYDFIDLASQQNKIRKQLEKAISRVLEHGQYIMGPEVYQLESELKDFTGASNVITCANGTDALTLVLMAWGIGPGDAIFVPSFTYVASAETPAQLGATPFFVDVHQDTFNINPESFKQAVSDAIKIGLRPAVVIPVDLFGQPSDTKEISKIAKVSDIKVLVDSAQSFGATNSGHKVGTMGDATTTSFFPAKPLGCYGDGGAIFTNDQDLASKVDSIRLHGKGLDKYDNVRIGINSRLDTLQAAILIEKLKIFPEELSLREYVASKYNSYLGNFVCIPTIKDNFTSSWAQYTLILEDRDNIKESLKDARIPTAIYYPKALSQQLGYSKFPSVSLGLNVSESLGKKVLSLPMHPYLKDVAIKNISRTLIENLKN